MEWAKSNGQWEIIISIKDEPSDTAYLNSLQGSVEELSIGKNRAFSMEEMNDYLNNNFYDTYCSIQKQR